MSIAELHREASRQTPTSKLAYTTVFKLWNNATRRPDLDSLDAVAKVLGVQPGDLIVREDETNNSMALAAA